MRVGDGALPGNFSRECYEDILAFKSALLSVVNQAHIESDADDVSELTFRLLKLDDSGNAIYEDVEVSRA